MKKTTKKTAKIYTVKDNKGNAHVFRDKKAADAFRKREFFKK